VAGAAIGIIFAWLLFGGYQHAMGGLVIRLAVTARLALTGVVFAGLLAIIGGLFPAIRAARLSVADALRAT
jgi:putative ABC transport system permease protein